MRYSPWLISLNHNTFVTNPCLQYSTGSSDWINCVSNTCPNNWAGCFFTTTVTFIVAQRLPSDGLFCKDTQIKLGLPTQNVYEAEGVNHSEENNTSSGTTKNGNDEMDRIFKLIWNRSQGTFFHIPTPDPISGC